MFVDAEQLKASLFERGREVGVSDAQLHMRGTNFQIEIRLTAARAVMNYDSWSAGYVEGYEQTTKQVSKGAA